RRRSCPSPNSGPPRTTTRTTSRSTRTRATAPRRSGPRWTSSSTCSRAPSRGTARPGAPEVPGRLNLIRPAARVLDHVQRTWSPSVRPCASVRPACLDRPDARRRRREARAGMAGRPGQALLGAPLLERAQVGLPDPRRGGARALPAPERLGPRGRDGVRGVRRMARRGPVPAAVPAARRLRRRPAGLFSRRRGRAAVLGARAPLLRRIGGGPGARVRAGRLLGAARDRVPCASPGGRVAAGLAPHPAGARRLLLPHGGPRVLGGRRPTGPARAEPGLLVGPRKRRRGPPAGAVHAGRQPGLLGLDLRAAPARAPGKRRGDGAGLVPGAALEGRPRFRGPALGQDAPGGRRARAGLGAGPPVRGADDGRPRR